MEVWTVGPWGETPFRRRAIARASAGCWDFHGGLVGSGPSLPAPINPPICTPALSPPLECYAVFVENFLASFRGCTAKLSLVLVAVLTGMFK